MGNADLEKVEVSGQDWYCPVCRGLSNAEVQAAVRLGLISHGQLVQSSEMIKRQLYSTSNMASTPSSMGHMTSSSSGMGNIPSSLLQGATWNRSGLPTSTAGHMGSIPSGHAAVAQHLESGQHVSVSGSRQSGTPLEGQSQQQRELYQFQIQQLQHQRQQEEYHRYLQSQQPHPAGVGFNGHSAMPAFSSNGGMPPFNAGAMPYLSAASMLPSGPGSMPPSASTAADDTGPISSADLQGEKSNATSKYGSTGDFGTPVAPPAVSVPSSTSHHLPGFPLPLPATTASLVGDVFPTSSMTTSTTEAASLAQVSAAASLLTSAAETEATAGAPATENAKRADGAGPVDEDAPPAKRPALPFE